MMDDYTKAIAASKFGSLQEYELYKVRWNRTRFARNPNAYDPDKEKFVVTDTLTQSERSHQIDLEILCGEPSTNIINKYGVSRQYVWQKRTALRNKGYRV